MNARHVVVIGAMASGKSTVGRLLARRLARPLRDSDDDMAADLGISARELAERQGVAALHRWEAAHLVRSLAGCPPAVVAAAASAIDDAACRDALAAHVVVWLRMPLSVVARRQAETAHGHRPELGGRAVDLAARRAPAYFSAADVIVDAADTGPAGTVDAVLAHLPRELQRSRPA